MMMISAWWANELHSRERALQWEERSSKQGWRTPCSIWRYKDYLCIVDRGIWRVSARKTKHACRMGFTVRMRPRLLITTSPQHGPFFSCDLMITTHGSSSAYWPVRSTPSLVANLSCAHELNSDPSCWIREMEIGILPPISSPIHQPCSPFGRLIIVSTFARRIEAARAEGIHPRAYWRQTTI